MLVLTLLEEDGVTTLTGCPCSSGVKVELMELPLLTFPFSDPSLDLFPFLAGIADCFNPEKVEQEEEIEI